MAIVDVARKTITLKVVYCGCALGGKTTNLITLHKLTDSAGEKGLVSIATKDDRALFFDLLSIDLGQIGALKVAAKVYTVPGQTYYESTRRQVLAGADGVAIVIDSDPAQRQANAWSIDNIRIILKNHGFNPDEFPTVLQRNKQDLPHALPVDLLEAEFNHRKLPSNPAVAVTGAGVVDTFAWLLKGAIYKAYAAVTRGPVSKEVLERTVDKALAPARERQPELHTVSAPAVAPSGGGAGHGAPHAPATGFEHRVDTAAYRGQMAGGDIQRKVLDQDTLLGEAVPTSMQLAERLEALGDVAGVNQRRERMLVAIRQLAASMADPAKPAVGPWMMAAMLRAAGRSRGSILLARSGDKRLDERETVPAGHDVLNAVEAAAIGTPAWRLAQAGQFRVIEDVQGEVFFGAPPTGGETVAFALVAPLACDGVLFGSVNVYGSFGEPLFDEAETSFWSSVASLVALALHWRALRKKMASSESASRTSGAGVAK